jgi:hypothetical protein
MGIKFLGSIIGIFFTLASQAGIYDQHIRESKKEIVKLKKIKSLFKK